MYAKITASSHNVGSSNSKWFHSISLLFHFFVLLGFTRLRPLLFHSCFPRIHSCSTLVTHWFQSYYTQFHSAPLRSTVVPLLFHCCSTLFPFCFTRFNSCFHSWSALVSLGFRLVPLSFHYWSHLESYSTQAFHYFYTHTAWSFYRRPIG